MGNYLGKKKTNPNLIDESEQHYDYSVPHEVKKHKKPTIYRPQIFIDYYKSKLFKVSTV